MERRRKLYTNDQLKWALELHALGKSHQEIANLTGIRSSSIRSLLRIARIAFPYFMLAKISEMQAVANEVV